LDQQKIADIAIGWLGFQNAESRKEKQADKKSRQAKINEAIEKVSPNQKQKDLGLKLGQYFVSKVDQIEGELNPFLHNAHINNFLIPDDYVVGMHIGDGSFGCEFRIIIPEPGESRRKRFEIVPLMKVIQSNDCRSLLEAYKYKFGGGKIEPGVSSSRFILRGTTESQNKILPLFDRYTMTETKQKQFNLYKTLVAKLVAKEHLRYEGFLAIVDLVYAMSELTPGERGVSKDEILEKGRKYFEKRR